MLMTTTTTVYVFKREWDRFKPKIEHLQLTEGECEELIAYYNGEPVTEIIVERARKLCVEQDAPLPLEIKALGSPLIRCSDGTLHGVDMGTLLRHFDYVSDLYELDPNIKEIQLPFSKAEIGMAMYGTGLRGALAGRRDAMLSIRGCFECIEYIRPKNSSYYLWYGWDLADDLSLTLGNGRIMPKESVLKFMRFIGSTLPPEVRMYRGLMSRTVMDYDFYPIVEIAFASYQERLLKLLLSHRPSTLLYCACNSVSTSIFNPLTILLEGDFENEKPCYPMKDWVSSALNRSATIFGGNYLENLKEEDRCRVLASFGLRDKRLGNVDSKAIRPFHADLPVDREMVARVLAAKSPTWMTPEIRAYFEEVIQEYYDARFRTAEAR